MRVLVTGGAGFIGSNLSAHLAELDWVDEVVVVDDLSTGHMRNLLGADVTFHEGSILDDDALDAAMDGVEAVVHLAAIPSVPRSMMDPMRTHHANATGTLNVLEAARRHGDPHLVVASSSSVYGGNMAMPKSEHLSTRPLSPYAVSKLAAEAYATAYASCFRLAVLPFRFFNVFGPGQPAGHAYAAAIPAFVDAALAGRPIPVFGDGLQSRDFTYVGTVVRTISDAIQRRVTTDEPVNLAHGSRLTLRDVIDRIAERLDTDLEVDHGPPRAGDVRHSQADSSRLLQLFPEVAATSFDEGLDRTIEWFRHSIDDLGTSHVAT